MLNDKPNVMTELAPKGLRSVEIIEIMKRPDIPFKRPQNKRCCAKVSYVAKCAGEQTGSHYPGIF